MDYRLWTVDCGLWTLTFNFYLLKRILFIFFIFALASRCHAQLDTKYYFGAGFMKGDSVPIIIFNPVSIYADRIFKNKSEALKYYTLVRNVKRVYPLARVCQVKIAEYNLQLSAMSSSKDKRLLLKKAEKELKDQFTPEIKSLTYTQGRILLKLIDRQTGDSSFELIKEYKGSINAVFWQFFAKVFGNDLKTKYDPYGDDKAIEDIVQLIEHGVI